MMNLTPHEAEVAALVLREHADEMDEQAEQWTRNFPRGAFAQPEKAATMSCRTRQLREIADKLDGVLI